MVLFNYSTRELTAKIVYYGPGLCGKTTNLQFIHDNLADSVKGKMLSLATKTDRTLFFDFLPIDLGEIRGMKTRVQLYTVPGQVFYNETRKLVLKGADGIVFVADSQEQMAGANVESFKNLEDNLKAHGMRLADMPHVIQFNKRDLPKLSTIEDLNATLNRYNAPFYESVATTGIGVQDTLKAIVKLVLLHLTKKYDPKAVPATAAAAAPAPAPVRTAPQAAEPPSRPVVIPASPMPEAPAPVAAPAPFPAVMPAAARVRPAAGAPAFEEEEIDALVGEVEDAYRPEPSAAAPAAAWSPQETVVAPPARPPKASVETFYSQEPPTAAAPPVPESEGTWLGTPEDDGFGSTLSLDDFERIQGSAGAPAPPAPETPTWDEKPAASDPFVVDRGFDPEWRAESSPAPAAPFADLPEVKPLSPMPAPAASHEAFEAEPIPLSPFPEEPEEAPLPAPSATAPPAAPADGSEIVLEEVAGGDELFHDPSLDVAKLEPGEATEILIPVQLGDGAAARRFKLSIRLRLDPVL